MQVEILEVAGLIPAMYALRLPYSKDPRSYRDFDTTPYWETGVEDQDENEREHILRNSYQLHINKEDITLANKLIKAGDEHSKVLRGVIAYLKVTAPLYFWNEASTYRIGFECLSSTSSMHTLGKRDISIRDFELPEIVYETLEPIKKETEIKPLFVNTIDELKSIIINFGEREYEVYNNGEIYSLPYTTKDKMPSGKIRERSFNRTKLTPTISNHGYYSVSLGGKKFHKNYFIHRLLAECFIPNPDNLPFVNHIDGNKWNCSLDNLEWCTSLYNNRHARQNGLNNPITPRAKYLAYWNNRKYNDDDIALWKQLKDNGSSLQEIALQVGTNPRTIGSYINGNRHAFMSPNWQEYEYIKGWEIMLRTLNGLAQAYRESGSEETFLHLKRLLPSAFLQTRILAISYQTLRRIYKQRKNHRLPDWHRFCESIERLPFAKELILV